MKANPISAVVLLLLPIVASVPRVAGQEVITLTSGNGVPGGTDAAITMLIPATTNTGFPAPFTTADFLNAQAGPPAFIPTSLAGGWLQPMPVNPAAQWITTNVLSANGDSALFAINFNVTTSNITYAELDFFFAIDDFLGDAQNQGLFVNFSPVGNTNPTNLGAAWANQNTLLGRDITANVASGGNTLFVYLRDTGGAGGINFAATVRIYDTPALSIPVQPTVGGLGLLQINADLSYGGIPFTAVPSLTAPFAAGFGIPLGGAEFLLDLTDPLLQFALFDPASTSIWPGLNGTISPVNGLGAVVTYVPPMGSLSGLTCYWQCVFFLNGSPSGVSSTVAMVVQ